MHIKKFITPFTRYLTPFGIGRRLTLGFGALAVVTLLVAALAFVAGRNATKDIHLTESVRAPASQASAQAQASLLRMQLNVRGYLVLSDPVDIEQYDMAKQVFEKNLAALQAMSDNWSKEEAKWITELTATYARWAKLPRQLFALHDNPLKNRPALRIARVDIQALRIRILDATDAMIGIQKAREVSPQNRELLTDLLGFQTSFDAMATNLMAYGASGELNFKLAYGPQLATNAAVWNTLSGKRRLLSPEQRAKLDTIARDRAQFAELALQIVSILNGEHAYEDLYLYRTEVAPQAEVLLGLLEKVTQRQQAQLQTGLGRARNSLADARLQTAAGGLLALIFSIALTYLFRRSIVGPVRRLTDAAEQVAAGNLAARATVESRDEIGTLATSINTMTQQLAETIEHLKSVAAEAQRARSAAEAANQAKSTFLANMSHELRTPLNGILGYAQILLRDKTLDAHEITGLTVIQKSGEHLLTLINDILNFAKIEAGKLELYVKDIQFIRFLRVIAEMIEVKAEQKDLNFRCDMAADLPNWVRVDEERLRQVLLNLLSNAVKFTDAGQVRLCVHMASAERIRFEVQDTGIGICADQLETIFQPFEQAGEARRRIGGTGLGLAIAKQLVRLMGGDLRVQSRLNEGSTFWFELALPTVIGSMAEVDVKQVVTGYQGARKTILVVDDVAENRAVAIDMLGQIGFDTAEASNGKEAFEKAQALQPDLILMDIVMPVMDGLEATRRLRELPTFKEVPIVAISASASGHDQERYLAAGGNAFLTKPIHYESLLAHVAALLKLTWIVQQEEVPAARHPSVPVDATTLPAALRSALEQALIRLDTAAVAHAIAEVPDAPLAHALAMLADEFQYNRMLQLIQDIDRKEHT